VYRLHDVRKMFVSKVGASRCVLMDEELSSVDQSAIVLCVLHNSSPQPIGPSLSFRFGVR
jgi:hypothetical protein